MEARLIQNAAVRVEHIDHDRVKMYVKAGKPRFLVPPLSWIVPVRRERATALDRVGTQIWRLCDGEKTVEEVIDAFATLHDLTFHESRVAVTGYARMLVQRGLLVIAVPKQAAGVEQ